MIYQAKGGPMDGLEVSIPEMPLGFIARIPSDTPSPELIGHCPDVPDASSRVQIAEYIVTDIGELTYNKHNGWRWNQ
jgi:hypothetical protein